MTVCHLRCATAIEVPGSALTGGPCRDHPVRMMRQIADNPIIRPVPVSSSCIDPIPSEWSEIPHDNETVGYSSAANLIVCPCHGSEFDPNTGAVVNPPSQHGLSSIQVAVDASGELVIEP